MGAQLPLLQWVAGCVEKHLGPLPTGAGREVAVPGVMLFNSQCSPPPTAPLTGIAE